MLVLVVVLFIFIFFRFLCFFIASCLFWHRVSCYFLVATEQLDFWIFPRHFYFISFHFCLLALFDSLQSAQIPRQFDRVCLQRTLRFSPSTHFHSNSHSIMISLHLCWLFDSFSVDGSRVVFSSSFFYLLGNFNSRSSTYSTHTLSE